MSNTPTTPSILTRFLDEIRVWIACRQQRRIDAFVNRTFFA